MNKETYDALKIVMELAFQELKREDHPFIEKHSKAVKDVGSWIDEVAKEYEEEELKRSLRSKLNR